MREDCRTTHTRTSTVGYTPMLIINNTGHSLKMKLFNLYLENTFMAYIQKIPLTKANCLRSSIRHLRHEEKTLRWRSSSSGGLWDRYRVKKNKIMMESHSVTGNNYISDCEISPDFFSFPKVTHVKCCV